VDPRPRLVALLECRAAARVHEAELLELLEPLDVDRAPDTALPPRRDPLRRAVIAQPIADAVDPTEAQLLVNKVLPRDRRPSRALAVISDPKVRGRVVVGLEPCPQLGGCLEEDDVLRLRQGRSERRTPPPGLGRGRWPC